MVFILVDASYNLNKLIKLATEVYKHIIASKATNQPLKIFFLKLKVIMRMLFGSFLALNITMGITITIHNNFERLLQI